MAFVKLYKKTGDKKAIEIQEKMEKEMGAIPEVFQAMGRNGDFLSHMIALMVTTGKGLDPKTKELIMIAVSAVNGCEYCFKGHSKLAKNAGVSEDEITAAVEVASTMSAFNNFVKGIGLDSK
ncbi:MAG: carboxymuconolactone decarboxylase family protein [Lentisphaeria bacterium]